MPFIPDTAQKPTGRFVPDEPAAKPQSFSETALPGMPAISWGDVGEAAGNALPSAANAIGDTYQAIRHPIETGKALYELGPSGILQFYKDRYGSFEKGLETFKKDPVGVLLDFSSVASLGGLAARAPGVAGRIASVAGKVGAATDPITQIGRGSAKLAGKLGTGAGRLGSALAGGMSGTGDTSVKAAFGAGLEGGAKDAAFKTQLRGKGIGADAVEHAKVAFHNIIRKRSLEYNGEMRGVYADKRILSKRTKTGGITFPKVDAALKKAMRETKHVPPFPGYTGKTFLPTEAGIVSDMENIVNSWRDKGPAYHTLGGLNDMKRELGEFVTKYDKGTTERRAADQIYNAVKESINDIEPKYKTIMENYDKASEMVRELDKVFRLNDKATTDSALRALQSTLRDNAHTTYGVRRQLMDVLVQNGAPHLVEELAGQMMKPWVRAGLGLQMAGASFIGSVGGAVAGSATIPISTLGMIAAMSPRLTGEVSHALGVTGHVATGTIMAAEKVMNKLGIDRTKMGQAASAVGRPAAQAGRLEEANSNKEMLKSELSKQAKRAGINIKANVLDTVASDLLSDDPDAYIKGISRIGKNKRLLRLMLSAATEKK